MNKQFIDQYSNILEMDFARPSRDELIRIIRSHLYRIPFENISKRYRFNRYGTRGITVGSEFLSAIKEYNFGGTCYSLNYNLNLLLNNLGYVVRLCGAKMKRENSHMVNIVTIENREYLVDVGYSAPFLMPIPLDADQDVVLDSISGTYKLLKKDQRGYAQLIFERKGKKDHGYFVNPSRQRLQDFEYVIKDSFRPSAIFMNAVLLSRHSQDASITISNLSLRTSKKGHHKEIGLLDKKELSDKIQKHFGIPEFVTEIALQGMSFKKDPWD
jgi:arylamine N-acetyltransferase